MRSSKLQRGPQICSVKILPNQILSDHVELRDLMPCLHKLDCLHFVMTFLFELMSPLLLNGPVWFNFMFAPVFIVDDNVALSKL